MQLDSWSRENTRSLAGKTIVITGATGGLGSAACRYLLAQQGNIIMVNRNRRKSEALCAELRAEYPQGQVEYLLADLTEIDEVRSVCDQLLSRPIDVLILDAGAYSIPREICSTGYDNVFTINFLSHYYMVHRLLPVLRQQHGKVVAVGSIAHNYVTMDPEDPDYAHHEGPQKIYGNSKRWLMFALMELLQEEPQVGFAIGHPGISFTGITSHYPKYQLMVVKPSMKLLFMSPKKAVRSIVKAIFTDVPYMHWIGPKCKDIWGNPEVKELNTCKDAERRQIFAQAETMYQKLLTL